ncbi:hypothetical protein FHS00_001932 [Limimaricola variabilis]|jgi:hypothetical protein|uniref:DUF3035 domain-containing protein n=1 Tax=Limimaricola variabilis TaxID=1492771 RepID=A0ABR6HP77_9RHOB|nr:hypothetical protein [Limimaricola variabilis]MBB3712350.1 hypothetical protein [Limimaricola variabilis]
MPRLLFLVPLLLAAGCAQFPEIDARVPEAERHGPPPPLVDVVPLLARADAAQASPRLTEASGTALAQRAEALSRRQVSGTPGAALPEARLRDLAARAEALRSAPVIDAQTRARIEAGVTTPAALQ